MIQHKLAEQLWSVKALARRHAWRQHKYHIRKTTTSPFLAEAPPQNRTDDGSAEIPDRVQAEVGQTAFHVVGTGDGDSEGGLVGRNPAGLIPTEVRLDRNVLELVGVQCLTYGLDLERGRRAECRAGALHISDIQ